MGERATSQPGWLGPGVTRLRPDDHFMVLMESDASPMHVGALLVFDAPRGQEADSADRLAAHLVARLPATPLLVELHQAPDGFDADVWVEVGSFDLDHHLVRVTEPLDAASLHQMVADLAVERLDLGRPPFRMWLFENLAEGGLALYLKVHHSVCDGIGFQSLLGFLHDQSDVPAPARHHAVLPDPEAWRALAEERFKALDATAAVHRARRSDALAALRSGERPERAVTPTHGRTGPVSGQRRYGTATVGLERARAVARGLGGTINDLLLAVVGGALRAYLLLEGDLPDAPLVVNASRSYRVVDEHGLFGNRIVAIHPHLATHLADPLERLAAIQRSMADELERSPLDEALLDAPEVPFGPRDRRARFAERADAGTAVLPGNVTVSNVPGPAEERSMAGLVQEANYPVPILGTGRFLNCTMRRNADRLDLGVMVDATKVASVEQIIALMADALGEYDELAGV